MPSPAPRLVQARAGRPTEADEREPVRVAAFTQGETIPSARLRVRQLVRPLRQHGIEVEELPARWKSYPPRPWLARPPWAVGCVASRVPQLVRGRQADVSLLQREFLAGRETLERLTKRPRVFDVDDAIHLERRGRGPARAIARRSDLVVCGNEHLARTYRAWATRVEVLATPVDTQWYVDGRHAGASQTLVWVGSASNLRYLQELAPALRRVLDLRPRARLHVVSDGRPEALLGHPQVAWTPWTPEAERAAYATAGVGLMPLPDNEWTRGKCSYKMLASMASSLPVVVSPVGMNNDVLALGDVGLPATDADSWVQALLRLLDDGDLRARMGATARQVAVRHYGLEQAAATYAGWLHELAEAH